VEYFYFADYQNMPFGNKPVAFLRNAILQAISSLVAKLGTGVVVLACNTATSVAIEFLRERLPQVVFVGTEPALKLAQDLGYERILLLATPNTIKYNKLIRDLKLKLSDNLVLSPEPILAERIENNIGNLHSLRPMISAKFEVLSAQKPDCVVLGCTHYLWIKDIIASEWRLPTVDGVAGVTNRLKSVVYERSSRGKISILTNDKSKFDNLKIACQKLNLGR